MKTNHKRVLIVDDAQDYRVLLSKAFKQQGYKVYLAKDGIEAYLKFFKVNPDIVLIDILLPKMRGDTLIKWLKGSDQGQDTPIIVVSGHSQMKDYVYQLGIELFFEKPCKVKEVLSAAEEILAIEENMGQLRAKLRALKLRFDQKYFTQRAEIEDNLIGPEYQFCARCHRRVPIEATRCPRCGNAQLQIKSKSDSF